MSADPKFALARVPLKDVQQNEFIALEITEDGMYDTKKHPVMHIRPHPIYQREGDTWKFLSSSNDDLFASVGALKREKAIIAYLNTLTHVQMFADLDIAAYNAQAGDEALVPDVDYMSERCLMATVTFDDKSYYAVDTFTYKLCSPSQDHEVDVFVFDGKRVPQIEQEEQQRYDELMEKQPRKVSVEGEFGEFIISLLVHDFLVLQYDVESSLYVLKQASTSRLYLLYASDKLFVRDMTPVVLDFQTRHIISSPLYSQVDNVTITISALLLELLHPAPDTRRQQRQALVAHNLEAATVRNLVHIVEGSEHRYISVENGDYQKHAQLFNSVFGRPPEASLFY